MQHQLRHTILTAGRRDASPSGGDAGKRSPGRGHLAAPTATTMTAAATVTVTATVAVTVTVTATVTAAFDSLAQG